MRIGIDLDGILANHRPSWVSYYNTFAPSHNHIPFDQLEHDEHQWRWLRRACKVCFDNCLYSEILYRNFPPFDDCVDIVKDWSKNHTLYVISKRPLEQYNASMDWLDDLEIQDCFKDIRIIGPGLVKSDYVEDLSIDLFIDDSPAVHEDIADFCPNTIRVALAHTYNIISDTDHRLPTWKDIDALVQSL